MLLAPPTVGKTCGTFEGSLSVVSIYVEDMYVDTDTQHTQSRICVVVYYTDPETVQTQGTRG